jgi:Fe-S cluster assembly iron-binding protein IscA
MWQVTDAVVDAMAQMRQENNAEADEGILLYFSPEGDLGLALAKPGEDDQVIAQNGSPIVIIAAETVQSYEGVTLDLEEDENGLRLHLFQDEDFAGEAEEDEEAV